MNRITLGVLVVAMGNRLLGANSYFSSCTGLVIGGVGTTLSTDVNSNTMRTCQVGVATCYSPNSGASIAQIVLPPAVEDSVQDLAFLNSACSGNIPGTSNIQPASLIIWTNPTNLQEGYLDSYGYQYTGQYITINSRKALQQYCQGWGGCQSQGVSYVTVQLNDCNGQTCSVANASGGVENPWMVANAFNRSYGKTVAQGTGFQNLSIAYGKGVGAGLSVDAAETVLDNVSISFPDSKYTSPDSSY